jgi:phospholipid-binding lipoprotein MlaA
MTNCAACMYTYAAWHSQVQFSRRRLGARRWATCYNRPLEFRQPQDLRMPALLKAALAPLRLLGLIGVLLIASGCATPGRTLPSDPLQGLNRGVYKFNDTLDRFALKPAAKGYRAITPRWFRAGVGHFFSNLIYPTTIINQVLQGKPALGLKDTGRFLVNTTIGIGGLLDLATPLGLESHDEDFGQTLAVWGISSGPFINLPLFGPSSLRDAPSRIVDYFTDPLTYVDLSTGTELGARALDLLNKRTELLSVDSTLQSTYDPYGFVRDAWAQQREFEIFDGEPPPETLEDFEDEPAEPESK